MVGETLCIAGLSSWQILAGENRVDTLWHLPTGSYLPLALIMLIGTFSCLSATVQSDSWTATAFEAFGSILLLGPLVVYLDAVVGTARYPDTDIVTALLAGLILGLLGRIFSITRDASGVVRARRSPPVGDLDLMTADRVDSVAAVIVDQHGRSAKREVDELDRSVLHPRHAMQEDGS